MNEEKNITTKKTVIFTYIFGAILVISMASLAIHSENVSRANLKREEANSIKQQQIEEKNNKELMEKALVLQEGRKMGKYYGGDEDCKLASETRIDEFSSETFTCVGGGVIVTSQGKIVSKAGI